MPLMPKIIKKIKHQKCINLCKSTICKVVTLCIYCLQSFLGW